MVSQRRTKRRRARIRSLLRGHREPPPTAHARTEPETESADARYVRTYHRHPALRARDGARSSATTRPRRRVALSRVRGDNERARVALSLVANTHCVGRYTDAVAAAVTCGATTSYPVAVVASTVHRPAARMSHRGRSAAPQRPSGTFTFARGPSGVRSARAPAHGVMDARRLNVTSRHSRSRVQASTRERRSRARAIRTPLVRRNYNRARIDRPRPLTPAVTLMSRQVTRAPHQVARSPPSGALPIKRCALPLRRSAHYRGASAYRRERASSLCPLKTVSVFSVCAITRDRRTRTRTRDVHARGYGDEGSTGSVRVENGGGEEIGAVDLWWDTARANARGGEREWLRASADFQPHYPRSAIPRTPLSRLPRRCRRRYLTVVTAA